MKRIAAMMLVMTFMISAAGCTGAGTGKDDKVSIRGQITKVLLDENQKVTGILVEGKLESDTSFDKASVRIEKNTKIYRGSPEQKLSAGDLKEGMKVEAIFEGEVAESYPIQARAKTIRVMEE